MEHAFPLIVIALLQLCQAEIPNALPEWYAANLINDANYSPKPLTEIFSTDASFTSRNTDVTQTSQITSTGTPWTVSSTNAPPSTNPTMTQGIPLMNRPQPPPAMSQVTASNQNQNQGNAVQIQETSPTPNTQSSAQTIPPTTQSPQTSTLGFYNTNQLNWLRANQQGFYNGINGNQNWLQGNQGNLGPYLPLSPAEGETPILWPNGLIANSPCDRQPMSTQGSVVSNIPQTPSTTSANDPITNTNQSGSANPVLTISVKRKGSKTNVLINPSTTTTTPTTTRRRKNNNYEACISSCRNRKEPICGSPRAVTPINPDNLKGFASMCHMACQNSFRNQQYEKVADGRCGKLRTRIRPVGQNKLNRDDLNKAQYSVVHNGDETVIAFSQLARSN